MNRKVTITILALVVAGTAAWFTFGHLNTDEPEFGKGTYREIETAMTDAGLDVQSSEGFSSEADVVGGFEQEVYDVFSPKGDGLVVVRAFSGPSQLDGIGEDSYLGDAVLGWRWQQFLVTITDASDPDTINLLRQGMNDLDAVEVFDLR